MAGLNTHVATLDDELGETLQRNLEALGYEFREVAHARFAAKGEGVNVVLYESGKCVVQGKGTQEFREMRLMDVTGLPEARLEWKTVGADESGKGDYFGPLVVAACALSPEEEPFLDAAALTDSKLLGDAQAVAAAEQIRTVLPHEIVVISPSRYNELYPKFGNLNLMLAWAHAKAITAVVDRSGCRRVVLDRFCDEAIVRRALGARAAELELEVRPRAEDNPAVAAASVIARAAFLDRLNALTSLAGVRLPKGAGSPVLKVGRALVQGKGAGILKEVAKLHFKTTRDIT